MFLQRCLHSLMANKIDKAHIIQTGLIVNPNKPEIDWFEMFANSRISPIKQLLRLCFHKSSGAFSSFVCTSILCFIGTSWRLTQTHLVFEIGFPKFDLCGIEGKGALINITCLILVECRVFLNHSLIERAHLDNLSDEVFVLGFIFWGKDGFLLKIWRT